MCYFAKVNWLFDGRKDQFVVICHTDCASLCRAVYSGVFEKLCRRIKNYFSVENQCRAAGDDIFIFSETCQVISVISETDHIYMVICGEAKCRAPVTQVDKPVIYYDRTDGHERPDIEISAVNCCRRGSLLIKVENISAGKGLPFQWDAIAGSTRILEEFRSTHTRSTLTPLIFRVSCTTASASEGNGRRSSARRITITLIIFFMAILPLRGNWMGFLPALPGIRITRFFREGSYPRMLPDFTSNNCWAFPSLILYHTLTRIAIGFLEFELPESP